MSRNNEEPIYVVVAENDQPLSLAGKIFHDPSGPLVFEQYTRHASLEKIKKRAADLSKRYGKCRIARLEFVDDEGKPPYVERYVRG